MTAEDVAGIVMATVKKYAIFRNHGDEVTCTIKVRDIISADRHQQVQHISRGATALIDNKKKAAS